MNEPTPPKLTDGMDALEVFNILNNERWRAHNREHELLDRARELLASEHKVHFENLNHEAARLISMQQTYLPREVWEGQQKEIADKVMLLASKQIELASLVAQNQIGLTAQAQANANEIGKLTASQVWLTRVIFGAIITAVLSCVVAVLFQRIGR